MSRTNFDTLLEAGCHFGHLKRKWNPAMAPYIFMERNGIHIIDLHKTVAKVDEAAEALKQIAKSGKKGVRYLFECKAADSKAPKYVQFSDHIIAPRKSSHFHIFMGNTSQAALLEEMENWPTYYPYQLKGEEVVDEMLHH